MRKEWKAQQACSSYVLSKCLDTYWNINPSFKWIDLSDASGKLLINQTRKCAKKLKGILVGREEIVWIWGPVHLFRNFYWDCCCWRCRWTSPTPDGDRSVCQLEVIIQFPLHLYEGLHHVSHFCLPLVSPWCGFSHSDDGVYRGRCVGNFHKAASLWNNGFTGKYWSHILEPAHTRITRQVALLPCCSCVWRTLFNYR